MSMQYSSCSKRLNSDIAELFSTNFKCSASHMTVLQTGDTMSEPGAVTLDDMVFEGPYRGGRFSFCFNIPANYPFRPVEVWATQPIWHPNIDIRTGKCSLPMEWAPVLTLSSCALAIQMLMLEPSRESPLNLEACSMLTTDRALFYQRAQESMLGGWINGIHFLDVRISRLEMRNAPSFSGKRPADSDSTLPKRLREGDDIETSEREYQEESPHKRGRTDISLGDAWRRMSLHGQGFGDGKNT